MYKTLISKIKEKKPLDRLDNVFVKTFIEKFFNTNPKIKKKFNENKFKKKDLEYVIKNVRNELNRIYGQFWLDKDLELSSHKSTKERRNYYSYIYKKILEYTGKPGKVLDLGAGLNPLSYHILGRDIYFIATELTDYDCNIIKDIFRKNKIKGDVIKLDLFSYNNLPKADVCFMFKLLDALDINDHKFSEKLMKNIDVKYVVVSFSTKSIRDKRMNYPRRGWFEIMLNRLNYKFTKFEIENEIFYVVCKN